MLKSSKFTATIDSLFINNNRDLSLASEKVTRIEVNYRGFQGEAHSGLTRGSCSRVLAQYPRGSEIRNVRQITIISAEEILQIAENMGIPYLEPQWLGANILVSGIPDFSLIPPSSRLISSSGVSIVVDMINGPCRFVGEVIDHTFPGKGKRFAKAANNIRGVTGWVEKTGQLEQGESLQLHLPMQPKSLHFE
ncbi:MAG: sulfurase [Oceanospirillaceae bacterium]|nr:sulfurase [Oceanospirillaceae bacterium]